MDVFEKMMEDIVKELEINKNSCERKAEGIDILQEVRDDLKFLNVEDTPTYLSQYIADYVSGSNKRGLYFAGNVGTGKTVRAKALAKILGCHYYTATEICELFVKDKNYWEELMFKPMYCVNVPFYNDIIVDDLGTELQTYQVYGTKYDIMADFLQRRYNMFPNVATHITTNLNKEEFMARYGERIHSRMLEMMRPIKLIGDDRRKTK